jgi:hypothetical protein
MSGFVPIRVSVNDEAREDAIEPRLLLTGMAQRGAQGRPRVGPVRAPARGPGAAAAAPARTPAR